MSDLIEDNNIKENSQDINNNYSEPKQDENTNTQQKQEQNNNSQQSQSTNKQQGYVPPNDFYKALIAERTARRVGTITLGLTLIAIGAIGIAFLFYPSLNFITIAKLSPIVFVFLGFEILINYFICKGQKMKYDFLSGFVCFMLIMGSTGVAAAVPVFNHFGPPKNQLEKSLSGEIYNTLYQQLSSNKNIKAIDVNVDLYNFIHSNTITVQELNSSISNVFISIELVNEYQTESDFANDCKAIIDVIKANNISFSNINISSNGKTNHHSMSLSDKFELNMDISGLNKLVESEKDNDESVNININSAT